MELFAELLENYPKFFEPVHQEKLWAEITSEWGVQIIHDFDAETVTLARMIIAYAQTLLDSGRLYTQPDDPKYKEVIGE